MIDGQILTGAHMQIVRDNFAMTAPALATTSGQVFAASGANTIAARFPDFNTVATAQTTTSTSYVDLATVGPSIANVTVGTRGLLFYGCQLSNDTSGQTSIMAPTGATLVSASDSQGLSLKAAAANQSMQASYTLFLGGMTPGTYTFTPKYRVTGGTGSFQDRRMQIVPF